MVLACFRCICLGGLAGHAASGSGLAVDYRTDPTLTTCSHVPTGVVCLHCANPSLFPDPTTAPSRQADDLLFDCAETAWCVLRRRMPIPPIPVDTSSIEWKAIACLLVAAGHSLAVARNTVRSAHLGQSSLADALASVNAVISMAGDMPESDLAGRWTP